MPIVIFLLVLIVLLLGGWWIFAVAIGAILVAIGAVLAAAAWLFQVTWPFIVGGLALLIAFGAFALVSEKVRRQEGWRGALSAMRDRLSGRKPDVQPPLPRISRAKPKRPPDV